MLIHFYFDVPLPVYPSPSRLASRRELKESPSHGVCYDASTMRGPRFILRDATVAIGFDESGKRIAVTIPAKTVIIVPGIIPTEPTSDHTEQITVTWDGRKRPADTVLI